MRISDWSSDVCSSDLSRGFQWPAKLPARHDAPVIQYADTQSRQEIDRNRIVDQKSSGEQEGQSTQKPVALLDQQRDSQTGEAVENHLEGQAPRVGSELFRMPEQIGKSDACEDGGPVVELGIGVCPGVEQHAKQRQGQDQRIQTQETAPGELPRGIAQHAGQGDEAAAGEKQQAAVNANTT